MSTTYLIDGYNFLHAMGVLHGRVGPTGLEKARRRLLGLLVGTHGEASSAVTVVFDAAQAPPDVPSELDYRGLHVRFAVAHEEADDLIELLIRRSTTPKDLTVVSDDHRVQQAARRRHCTVLGCQEYLEWLDRQRREGRCRARAVPEKRGSVSPQEMQRWLSEFGDLEDDPGMKDVFDPFGFGAD
jgi:predicted RNA-binding protein with PIN domain